MRRAIFFLASVLVLGLAACTGPVLTQSGSPYTQIDSLYNYGAGDRDLKLVVQGNPFPMPNDVFARVVETDLQLNLLRQPTHPTLTPGPTAKDNYALVFVFSPPLTLTADDLCNGRADQIARPGFAPPVAGAAVTLRALAAFCVSGRAETEIIGETQATGAGDVRFLELMRQMMLALFRPDLRDGGHGQGTRLF